MFHIFTLEWLQISVVLFENMFTCIYMYTTYAYKYEVNTMALLLSHASTQETCATASTADPTQMIGYQPYHYGDVECSLM